MDALEFIRERNRVCKSFGDGEGCMSCPFYKEGNRCMAILWKEEIVPIVEKWSKEHPCKTPNCVKSTKTVVVQLANILRRLGFHIHAFRVSMALIGRRKNEIYS